MLASSGRLSGAVFLLGVGVVIGLVVAALLAFLLGYVQGASYYEAAYSTVLTLLLIGPTIHPTSGYAEVLIALTGIDGLVIIVSVLGLVFAGVESRIRG